MKKNLKLSNDTSSTIIPTSGSGPSSRKSEKHDYPINLSNTTTKPGVQETDRVLAERESLINFFDETRLDNARFKEEITADNNAAKKDVENSIKKLKNQTNKMEEENKNKDTKTIETLGIFFALFTFISVNIQIFTKVNDLYSAIVFCFIFFLLISSILILFVDLLRQQWLAAITVLVLSLVIGLVILLLLKDNLRNVILNPVESTKELDTAVDNRIQDKIKENFYNKNDIDKLLKELTPTVVQSQ